MINKFLSKMSLPLDNGSRLTRKCLGIDSNLSRFCLVSLICVLMLTLGVGNAWGALSSPYTCTFTSGMSMSGSNCTTGDVTWTISTTTGKGSPSITFGNQNGQSCIKFGSGKSNYYSKMTLTTSAFSAYNVSSVVIYASSNNGGSKTFKVTQGATQIGTGSQSFSSTTWVTNITRNTTAGSGGDLSIEISSDATATFVHSIKVTYSAACSTPPTVGSSLSSVSATVNSITATVPISSIGGCNITENGLVYSTSVATPTVGAANCTKVTTTACGGTAANKTVTISDLACGTPYYVRGYATNAAGTQYTNVTTQSTSACPLYTVTLKDNDATLTQASAGASVTLPSRAGCSGYTFAGWTKSWVAPQTSWTTTAPTIIPAGSYTPAGDEDLYPVYTKTEGGASEDHDGPSFSRSSSTNTITTGYTLTTNASAAAAYYADQTPNGTNIYVGIYNSSTPIFSSTPSSITITATIGGGSGNKDLEEPILAQLLDNTGSPIGTAATITTHVTNSGGDTYSDISIPTTGITSAYGVRISHIKESGWNARYYSFSLSYTTGGSVTSYISVPNCCTPLATINGSFLLT